MISSHNIGLATLQCDHKGLSATEHPALPKAGPSSEAAPSHDLGIVIGKGTVPRNYSVQVVNMPNMIGRTAPGGAAAVGAVRQWP